MNRTIEIEQSMVVYCLKLNRDKIRWKSMDINYQISFLAGWPFKEPPDVGSNTVDVPAKGPSNWFTPTAAGQFFYSVQPAAQGESGGPRPNPDVIVDP